MVAILTRWPLSTVPLYSLLTFMKEFVLYFLSILPEFITVRALVQSSTKSSHKLLQINRWDIDLNSAIIKETKHRVHLRQAQNFLACRVTDNQSPGKCKATNTRC